VGSLSFLCGEAWRNLRRQGLLTLASVTTAAAALTIFAAFLLTAWHVHSVVRGLPRRFEVRAYTLPSLPRQQSLMLAERIRAVPGVEAVRLVTREEAWRRFRGSFRSPEDLAGLGENPLPDRFDIRTTAPEHARAVAAAVRAMSGIERVNAQEEAVRRLLALEGITRLVGTACALLLALGTAAIIGNTIRLTLFARQRQIQVMQLVGATDGFIRLPYLLEGMVQGLAGGLLAGAATAAGVAMLTRRLADFPLVAEARIGVELPLVFGALAFTGALLGCVGSLVSLRRFLQPA
jgi:cell division transport system permease protein